MNMADTDNLCLWCMEPKGENPSCPHCGHDLKKNASEKSCLQPGTLLNHDRYLIGRVLGRGRSGIIYLAYDRQSRAKRAIKEYFPQELLSAELISRVDRVVKVSREPALDTYRSGMDLFYRKMKSYALAANHPNLVRVYQSFAENSTMYFVMEYVEGISFSQYLKDHGNKLSWEETLSILTPVADALSSLHQAHLLHRDVIPDNIILTQGKFPKLLGFGAAIYEMAEGKVRRKRVVSYIPLECCRLKNQGTYTDVYALASIFYYAVSGVEPLPAWKRAQQDSLLPLYKMDSHVPYYIGKAVSHAMAVNGEDRTQTMSLFLEELNSKPEVRENHRQRDVRTRNPENKVSQKKPKTNPESIIVRPLNHTGNGNAAEKSSPKKNEPNHESSKACQPGNTSINNALQKSAKGFIAAVGSYIKKIPSQLPKNTGKYMVSAGRHQPEYIQQEKKIIESFQNIKSGDTVPFGHLILKNTQPCQEVPIEWLVLAKEENQTEKKFLLLSNDALFQAPYNKQRKATNWEKSTLREVLNGPFIEKAFNNAEQNHLSATKVKADEVPEFRVDPGNDTQDKVFILSAKEIRHYVHYDNSFRTWDRKKCRAIGNADENGAYCEYWVRSVAGSSGLLSTVDAKGAIQEKNRAVNNKNLNVRAAVWVSIDKNAFGNIANLQANQNLPANTKTSQCPQGKVLSGKPFAQLPHPAAAGMRNAQVGDHLYYGHYEQDNNLPNGPESVEWRVLDRIGNRLLLLSEYGLDVKPWNETKDFVTWENCSLRAWLNGAFYKSVFSAEEQKKIVKTFVKAEINPVYSTDPGNDTSDSIFLLSISEGMKYLPNDADRKCKTTAYAEANYASSGKDSKNIGWWWLRSPGGYPYGSADINGEGAVNYYGSIVTLGQGLVRPAFWLNL